MSFSPIDDLPTAPQRTDEADVFVDRADAFVAALVAFQGQLNTFIAELETAAALVAAAPAYADPGLVALTGLTPAADRLPYFTGSGSSALATLTGVARTLLAQTSQANMRSTGLGLGSAATANTGDFDAAGAASSAVSSHVAAGDPHTQYLLESAVSSFIMTLLDDADQAAAQATLGVQGGLTYTAAGSGYYITLPIGGTTYYLQFAEGTNAATEATQSITWPHAFGIACLFAMPGAKIPSANNASDWWFQLVGSPGTTSVTVQRQQSASGTDGGGASPLVIGFGY